MRLLEYLSSNIFLFSWAYFHSGALVIDHQEAEHHLERIFQCQEMLTYIIHGLKYMHIVWEALYLASSPLVLDPFRVSFHRVVIYFNLYFNLSIFLLICKQETMHNFPLLTLLISYFGISELNSLLLATEENGWRYVHSLIRVGAMLNSLYVLGLKKKILTNI